MQVLTHDLLPTLGVPVVVETEIDETTNEVVSTYPCSCVRTQRLAWYRVGGRGSHDISARPSISSDETERCEQHHFND